MLEPTPKDPDELGGKKAPEGPAKPPEGTAETETKDKQSGDEVSEKG